MAFSAMSYFVFGETVTAARINNFIDNDNYLKGRTDVYDAAWSSYTPTWSNVTVGNGTNVGKYLQIGKTVLFKASFTFGTTSSAASSPISVSLPVTAAALLGTTLVDSLNSECTYYDQSGSIVLSGYLRWVDTSNVRLTARTVSGSNVVSSSIQGNTPIALTNLDELHVRGSYETA